MDESQLALTARPVRSPRASGPGALSYERMLALASEMQQVDPLTTFALLRPVCDEVWNLMDGFRTLGEIRDAICVQFDVEISQRHIEQLVALMVADGRVILQP